MGMICFKAPIATAQQSVTRGHLLGYIKDALNLYLQMRWGYVDKIWGCGTGCEKA
jgi:hypothetical protein